VPADFLTTNKKAIAEFRSSGGKCGPPFEDYPIVLVTMTGAKSGRQLCSPLAYSTDGDDLVVIASMAGFVNNPNWYHNLKANPDVALEVGEEKYDAVAVLTEGEERDRLYAAQAEQMPIFHKYADKAAPRVIPVFRLVRKQTDG
jgi:deazaflavin-dependent oxidoreductase (nitroreductase family)